MHKHFYWSDGSPYTLTAWDAGYPKDYTSQSELMSLSLSASCSLRSWTEVFPDECPFSPLQEYLTPFFEFFEILHVCT